MYLKLVNKCKNKLRDNRLRKQSKKLKNKEDITIISSNCIGGFILHDLGIRFNTPTINLFIAPHDFIKYVKNIKYYSQCKLEFRPEASYPIGYLEDVQINFMHYKSEEEALQKWKERTSRINYNNISIIMTDRDGCTYQDMIDFDHLPYEKKIIFTHKDIPEIKSSYHIKGFEKESSVGHLYLFKNAFSTKKYYDDFDYILWLNS